MSFTPPTAACVRCPRLVQLRQSNAARWPDWHNAPVDSFGPLDATVLVVGLAPGLKGANRTGRPFTGDYAGLVLYPALVKHGLAVGTFDARVDDGLVLTGARVTNAVRCLPPENKPTGVEVKTCRPYLIEEMAAMRHLKVILTLGAVSHGTVLSTLGLKKSAHPFAHNAAYAIGAGRHLVASYHTSRYNMNTGRLTEAMFDDVMTQVARLAAR